MTSEEIGWVGAISSHLRFLHLFLKVTDLNFI